MADKLGDFIVGTAIETIETEKLISEFEEVIINDVYEKDKPVESVVNNLQEYVQTKGIQMNTVVMEDVYADSAVARENVSTWVGARNLGAATSLVTTVSTFVHQGLFVFKALIPIRSMNLALKPNSLQVQAQDLKGRVIIGVPLNLEKEPLLLKKTRTKTWGSVWISKGVHLHLHLLPCCRHSRLVLLRFVPQHIVLVVFA